MKLIVLRHGESQWNHENRFGGWIDIPLSPKGEREAQHAGDLLAAHNIVPSMMYTSLLQRSIKTGHLMLEQAGRMWIPHHKTWRLNERHYGAFQGQDKHKIYTEYGSEQYNYYRRDFRAVPPLATGDDTIDERYASLPEDEIPRGESLQMVMQRSVPFILDEVVRRQMLQQQHTVLLVTHGSVVRSLIKHFCAVSDEDISKINAPTGVPLVFELDDEGSLVGDYYYLDEELARKGMAKVEAEGRTS